MSTERSSSAVRNLRAVFENKTSDSPDARGRGSSSARENSRPTSKVRASFVSVDRTTSTTMEQSAANTEPNPVTVPMGTSETKPVADSAATERGGSDELKNGPDTADLKKALSVEQELSEKDPKAEPPQQANAESADVNSTVNAMKSDGKVDDNLLAAKQNTLAAHVNKSVPEVGEGRNEPKPAEPTHTEAVSTGEALAPGDKAIESDDKSDNQPTARGKIPATISTKTKAHAASVKSPSGQPKNPLSASASAKSHSSRDPPVKSSRSSLTAPTAASVARASAHDKSSDTVPSPPTKSRARDTTKPIDLPSRLTAPTAASKARHELDHKTTTGGSLNGKASTSTRPKPASTSARLTPRTSLAAGQRPESHAPVRKPAPADGGFLERMMRPTAASAQKAHEKIEPKAHAHQPTVPAKHAQKPVAKAVSKADDEPVSELAAAAQDAHPVHQDTQNGDDCADPLTEGSIEAVPESQAGPASHARADEAKKHELVGNETPMSSTNGHTGAELESTPAFGGEEAIR